MSKRLVIVGGATAVAGLVLGASVVFGPDAVTGVRKGQTHDIDAPTVQGKTAGTLDTLGATGTALDIKAFDPQENGEILRLRIRADRSNLKPLGVTELVKPRADIHLGSQRAISIIADKADTKMENREIREGTFIGNVVVTLFEAPPGVKLIIDADDPEHTQFIQQRIFLDSDTHFSVEDDSINTAGPVHVTSNQVDFFGVGLHLTYNTQRERIEQLLIDQGRYLLFNPEADSPGFDNNTTPSADADNNKPADDDAASEPQPALPSQYYLAEFAKDVVVRSGIHDELAGELLKIDFSLGTKAVTPKPATPTTSRLPQWVQRPGARLAQLADDTAPPGINANPTEPTLSEAPILTIPQRNAERSMFSHVPQRDLVVTWAGHLRLTPLAEKPEALADDKDVRITLIGDNAYAQSTEDDQIKRLQTIQLEYLLSQELTTALASDDKPVRLFAEALGGELTAQKLIVRQQAGTATLLGPGQLTYRDPKTNKPLTVTWQNRLDLELYIQPPDANPERHNDAEPHADAERSEASGTQTKLLGIQSATFDGKVTALHPEFDLAADKLTLAFRKPDNLNNIDNEPTQINAFGNIAIKANGDDPNECFHITAQHLTVSFQESDRTNNIDNQPIAIRAEGGVEVRMGSPDAIKGGPDAPRPDLSLACRQIKVDLNPSDNNKPDNPPQPDEEIYGDVSKVFAIGDVRATIHKENQHIALVSDVLIADVIEDKLTLNADNLQQPAEVIEIIELKKPNGQTIDVVSQKLTGKLVEMDNKAEQLDITGPGSLATRLDDPDNPDASIENSFLSIAWDDAMSFNNVTGKAKFLGKVRSESRRSNDYSELFCNQLDMRFSPDFKHDPQRLIEDDGRETHERQVRSAIAQGDVSFMAASWEQADPKKISNRMRIQGPTLIFTNTPAIQIGDTPVETVVVQGAGRMTLEDYRPPVKQPAGDDAASKRAFMTGRGSTLFTWNDRMILDARTNTATLHQTVTMTHIPRDEDGKNGQAVGFACDKLLADMTDTGGLSVWLSDEAPDARVTRITADGNVRLAPRANLAIAADHLKFLADAEKVNIWSDDKRPVVLEDNEAGTTDRLREIEWNLATDSFELKDFQGGSRTMQ